MYIPLNKIDPRVYYTNGGEYYYASNLTNYVTGYPTIVSTVTSLAVTGLSYGDYYYTISAIGAEDCASPVSNTILYSSANSSFTSINISS